MLTFPCHASGLDNCKLGVGFILRGYQTLHLTTVITGTVPDIYDTDFGRYYR